MSETVETKTNFDQTASPLKSVKNIMTPAGVVMRVTDTDLKWFNHFYTFEAQGKKCYQSIKTIAKGMGRAVSAAQERIDKLQALGLLEVGKETFKDGWRNTYTCTPIDVIVSRMTDAPVTPQDKPLKKSQLNSLLKKSREVDPQAVNRGIRAMAKTIANRDLSDDEVMQFAFQIAGEKLAALGWPIETIIEESNDEDEQSVTNAPETATPSAGVRKPLPDVHSVQHDDVPSDDAVTGENVVGIPWIESPFNNGRLVPDARRWAQSKGAATWQEEIKLVWEMKGAPNLEPGEHMRPGDESIPVPEPAKQQVNRETPEYIYDEDDSEIPF